MSAAMLALGIIARRARLHKSDSRIDAERKRALLAAPPIGQAPVFGSVRSDQQVQTAIGELARLGLPLPFRHFVSASGMLVSRFWLR
jgi:predicted nicotinamide N-methyase